MLYDFKTRKLEGNQCTLKEKITNFQQVTTMERSEHVLESYSLENKVLAYYQSVKREYTVNDKLKQEC